MISDAVAGSVPRHKKEKVCGSEWISTIRCSISMLRWILLNNNIALHQYGYAIRGVFRPIFTAGNYADNPAFSNFGTGGHERYEFLLIHRRQLKRYRQILEDSRP